MALFSRISTDFELTPNIQSYQHLTHALAVEGRYIQTTRLIQNMVKNGVIPSEIVYKHLIMAASKSGKGKRALEVYTHYKREGGTPSLEMTAAIIHVLGTASDGQGVLDLFEQTVAKYGSTGLLGGDFHSCVVNSLAACEGYLDDAITIGEAALSSLTNSNTAHYVLESLIRCCEITGDVIRMRHFYNQICLLNAEPLSNDLIVDVLRVFARFIRSEYIFLNADNPTVAVKESPSQEPQSRAFADTEGVSHSLLMQQVEHVWRRVVNPDTKMTDAYLKVLCSSNVTLQQALHLFDTGYSTGNTNACEKSGDTFKYLLRHVAKTAQHMNLYGDRVWSEFIAWDEALEHGLASSDATVEYESLIPGFDALSIADGFTNDNKNTSEERMDPNLYHVSKTNTSLSFFEKEELRIRQGRPKALVRELFLRIANGYSRY